MPTTTKPDGAENGTDENKVDPRVLDAVTSTNVAAIGVASDEAMAVSYESLAHSISLIMQNAGSTQYAMKQIEAAAVAKTCQKILSLIK